MRKSHRENEDAPLRPQTKICSYCDEHRRSRDAQRRTSRHESESQRQSLHLRTPTRDDNKFKRNKFSQDEVLVKSSDSSSGQRILLKSSAIVRDGSPTSCLKKTTSKIKTSSKTRIKKKVNFYVEDSHAKPNIKEFHESSYDDDEFTLDNETHSFTSQETPQVLYDSYERSNSSSHYERRLRKSGNHEETYEANMRKLRELTAADSSRGQRELLHGKYSNAEAVETQWLADSTSSSREYTSVPRSHRSHLSKSSSRELTDKFNRLSLTSTDTCCSSGLKKNLVEAKPRVVRPKDRLGRAAAKKMLIYPPEGQSGAPLTLLKKWSNVACHVRGDSERGYRYKVYYLQTFESERWFPDEETGGPFHRVHDSTTDYG